jgi:hypothetical protein
MFVYDAGRAIGAERPEALAYIALEFFERRDPASSIRTSGVSRPSRLIQALDQHCQFTDIVTAGGALPVARLIGLPEPKKAGSSDAPEPLSSNDVAATMALNSVRISRMVAFDITAEPGIADQARKDSRRRSPD